MKYIAQLAYAREHTKALVPLSAKIPCTCPVAYLHSTVHNTTEALVTPQVNKPIAFQILSTGKMGRFVPRSEVTHYVQFLLFLVYETCSTPHEDLLSSHPLLGKTASLATEMIRHHSVIESLKLRHLMKLQMLQSIFQLLLWKVSHFNQSCVITLSHTEILDTVGYLSWHQRLMSEN